LVEKQLRQIQNELDNKEMSLFQEGVMTHDEALGNISLKTSEEI
jgi:hypothetical protein